MSRITMQIGKSAAQSLFVLGNSFNLSHSMKSVTSTKIFENNDCKAIASDWQAVGKGVGMALDQYGNTHKREAVAIGCER